MPDHEHKNCPRCGSDIKCKVGDITNCQCFGITLTVSEEAFIAQQYPDECLCRNCLQQLQSRYHLFLEQKVYHNQR